VDRTEAERAGATRGPLPRTRPLIITGDAELLDDLLRLAAAGSSDVTVAHDAVAALDEWSAAAFVVIGADCLAELARLRPSPRTGVILVAGRGWPEPPWALAEAARAEHVAVLPDAEAWLVDQFADHVAGDPARARVVAIVGGSGGAGASVLATALAVTARRKGLETLLIDGDPLGGGVDLVLGWERMQGLRWPELVDARGRVNPPALVSALPGEGSLAVLSFGRTDLSGAPAPAMAAALDAGRRGRDLVVVDLPRWLDDASLMALTAADRCYLVVPAEIRACAAAERVSTVVGRHCPSIAVVVRAVVPGGIPPKEVAEALSLPLAGVMAQEPRLVRSWQIGRPPARSGRGPLAELCRELLVELTPRRRAATR
jgi:secretion/DNA translocation related CpaE-like protein